MESAIGGYLLEVLGINVLLAPLPKGGLNVPLYISEGYHFFTAELYQKQLLIVVPKDVDDFSVFQTEKQFEQLRKIYPLVVLCLPHLAAYNRKRLIEKGINFIVPGKQLFLPTLLIDLRETELGIPHKRKQATLLPSAQFLVLYHLLHQHEKWQLQQHPFKAIAEKTGYTSMAITKAVANLAEEEIIDVKGDKEKFIQFRLSRAELWHELLRRKLFINPILKKVFVDALPPKPFLLQTGASALPEYSDMNPSRQRNYAIDRNLFYRLDDEGSLPGLNEQEGLIGLEVWKYDPLKLLGELPVDRAVVDPLSLYLSLQDNTDERVEMARDRIPEQYIY